MIPVLPALFLLRLAGPSAVHALSLALVAPAEAAQTGNISGKVEDQDGIAVPGALVTLSGNIAIPLQATTDDGGNFAFLNIAPGGHQLEIAAPGLAPAKVAVTVRLDVTSFVPVKLQTGSVEVTVTDTPPAIDTTKSSVSTELSADALANLPTARSYQATVNMLPGVSGRVDTQSGGPGTGNPSVRGEGQYGNNYLVDGISTRDPATKQFGTDVNYDAIQDIQVYTDGAPAEFGQATGMLVNVVTKDGGDEHHGSGGYYFGTTATLGKYDIADLNTHQDVPTIKRHFLDQELSLTAGGPLIKQQIWYFASLDMSLGDTVYENADPAFPYAQKAAGGFGKISWFATPNLEIQYQLNGQVSHVDNYETSSQYAPDAQSIYSSDDLGHELTVKVRPAANGELELQGLYQNGHILTTPSSGDVSAPTILNHDTGVYTGNYTDVDADTRSRAGGSAKYSLYEKGKTGVHRPKAGLELWRLYEDRALTYTGADQGYQYVSAPDEGYPCVTPDHSDCYGYTQYSQAGTIGHAALVLSGFLQDDWQPIPNFSTNLGLRGDRETLHNSSGAVVVDSWMVSPRIGASWDVTNDKKTLLSVNAGRYFDLQGNTFADWGDTRSAFIYKQYSYNPQTGNYDLVYEQNPETSPSVYCNKQSLGALDQATQDLLSPNCNGNLRPYHMDKLVLGVQRELVPLFVVGLRGILSQTVDLPEDVDIDGSYFIITNPKSKRRDYKALEVTATRQFDKHWQVLASYTLSESKGTMPGQFEVSSGGSLGSDGNEVGVYDDDVNDKNTRTSMFDGGSGWILDGLNGLGTESNDAGYYGYLPYHSFHSVKVNGSYTFNTGSTVGLVYEFDSGHAWQKRGYTALYQDYYSFPEGRGSRFMPPVNYIDLHLAQDFDLKHGRSAEINLDVFNVADFQTPITYYENDNANFGLTLYRQEPRSIKAGVKVTY